MAPLEPPDSHHLNAAVGWLELGAPREAAHELSLLSAAARQRPEALEILWRVCAAGREWTEALHVACLLVKLVPDGPVGWIHQAFALHELGRTEEALRLLGPARDRFPNVSTIPYNLACYCCRLGRLTAARTWLAKTVQMRSREEIQALALDDADLEPLWPEIAAWGRD